MASKIGQALVKTHHFGKVSIVCVCVCVCVCVTYVIHMLIAIIQIFITDNVILLVQYKCKLVIFYQKLYVKIKIEIDIEILYFICFMF